MFQRTPPWIFPHPDRPCPALERAVYRLLPPVQDAHRNLLFGVYEATGSGFHTRPSLLAPIEAIGRAHLRRQVPDPVLREQLAPRYRFGCKRPILSNTYYPALPRDNVALVTDPIARVNKRSITTADGTRHHVDTIISAVGYRYNRSLLVSRISGARRPHARRRLGSLAARLPRRRGARASRTCSSCSGPNCDRHQLGDLLARGADRLRDGRAASRWSRRAAVEVRPDALEEFVAEVDRRNEGSVWTAGGCQSYYLDASGRQFALYPGFASQYRRRTRTFDPSAYELAS